MTQPEFIDDLIPLILEAGEDHWWPCHLAALATVSPAWLFYVRKRLYSHPRVHDLNATVGLADTLEKNPDLQMMVKGIALEVDPKEMQCRNVHIKAVRTLLGLEGLKHVDLGGILASERYLRLIADPDDIEDITIHGSCLSGQCLDRGCTSSHQFEWDEAFGFGFPSLQTLRLAKLNLHVELPTTPYPTTISRLILDQVTFIPGAIQHLLNGARTLTCLHLNCVDPVDEELQLVLSSCAIRCLHYEVQKTTFSDPFTDLDPEHGKALHCLHLDGPLFDAGMLNTISTTFRNIEELAVKSRTVRIPAQGWIDLIRSDTSCSGLRRLGIPWGTSIPPFTVWSPEEIQMVRDACAARKIELLV